MSPDTINKVHEKYSDVLGDWLLELGYTHCFFVAGGGCMHLIDGFRNRFIMVAVVHEVSAGIAVEHFNECTVEGKAFALVTTGPGLTNIVTAIAGCYTERRELLVIAGQVKTTDLLTGRLRERGVQEVDGTALTQPISVQSLCLKVPIGREDFRALVKSASYPHPGPVVIEVCLDVQGAKVERAVLDTAPKSEDTQFSDAGLACGDKTQQHSIELAAVLSGARRPVILLGGLVSRSLVWDSLSALEGAGIPVMTATSAIDRIPSSSPIYAGRPGSWGGQRAANLLIAQADVVVGIGVQWDLQQTGFNWKEYAPNAQIYQVYPCLEELDKGHPVLTGAVAAVPDELFVHLLPLLKWNDDEGWIEYIRKVQELLPVLEPGNTVGEGYISSFSFLQQLSRSSGSEDAMAICSSGGTFTGGLQMCELKPRQYSTTSPAFASMGYGLATAIGVAFARPGKRVILIEGDGGFSQNLQELAMLKLNNLPIKIFLFDNLGYGSIRATQRKFFSGAYVGCDTQTGLGFPDWIKLFAAYDIPARYLRQDEITVANLAELMQGEEPEAWIISIDPEQPNWPAVSSRILPDGSIVSNPLYQMLPTLEEPVAAAVSKYIPKTV